MINAAPIRITSVKSIGARTLTSPLPPAVFFFFVRRWIRIAILLTAVVD